MSAFARPTFSAAAYAAFRPTYPSSLYARLIPQSALNSRKNTGTLLDLGTGTGAVAANLSQQFQATVALDASPGMIETAKKLHADAVEAHQIQFRIGTAEDLSFLSSQSVSMVVAGQAAHWFDYSRTWPELARVVRSAGTLAFWGYKDNVLLGLQHATDVFDKYCYASGEVGSRGMAGMGPYWEPGRQLVRNLLRDVQVPDHDWEAPKMETFEPQVSTEFDDPNAWMKKAMKVGEFEAYVRTFSAYRAWMDAHPGIKSRADGGEGDIVDEMLDEMYAGTPEWQASGENFRDLPVRAVWGTYILTARRR